jgi:hypothetical protein
MEKGYQVVIVGAGPVMAQKIMIQRVVDYEYGKELVKEALGILKK